MKNLLYLCSLDLLTAFFLEADAPAHRHDLSSLIIQRGDHIVIDYLFYPHAPLLKCSPCATINCPVSHMVLQTL